MVRVAASTVGIEPVRAPDDLVVSNLGVVSSRGDPTGAAVSLDGEPQDLTGLVGPASARGVLPEEETAGDTPPFCVLSEERSERLGISAVERVGSSAKLVDHRSSVPLGT